MLCLLYYTSTIRHFNSEYKIISKGSYQKWPLQEGHLVHCLTLLPKFQRKKGLFYILGDAIF